MTLSVSTLGLLSMAIRIVGSVFLCIVIIQQLKLRFKHTDDELNGFRNLLITLTTIPFLFNFLFIYNNYVRFIDGHQNELINNLSFVMGAIASTLTAMVLWLIYRNR